MFGEVVQGIPSHVFENALTRRKADCGVKLDTELGGDDLRGLCTEFKRLYREGCGEDFPQDAREQLRLAVGGVFRSWGAPRAKVYRRAHEISDDLGTACNVCQMVFGNRGEGSGTGVCFTPQPGDRRAAVVRRVPPERAGRGRRRRHPHARADRAPARGHAQGLRRSRGHGRAPRALPPRDAGHRVHDRAGSPVHAAVAYGQAHRAGRPADRPRVRRRGHDHAGRGRPAHRPGPDRAPPAPPARRVGRGRADRARPRCLPGRGRGRSRVRRRHRGAARRGRRGGRARALGDDAGRHPRIDPGAGRRHLARRHDLARRRRRARHGQALRGRRRGRPDRRRGAHAHRRQHGRARRRHDHDRRRGGDAHAGRASARGGQARRGLRRHRDLGRRAPPPRGARQRRHARGRAPCTRARRRGHRPLPHRAHVHGRPSASPSCAR